MIRYIRKKSIKNTLLEIIVVILLTYPLFYFTYKSAVPSTLGQNDYNSYYQLYDSWDYESLNLPFNTRLISTYLTHLLIKLNIHYDTEINYSNSVQDKIVFFNVLLFNYLALIATFFLIYKLILYNTGKKFFSFSFSFILFFSYGTLFFTISPLTDALGLFLVALCFYYYIKKSYLIIIPLLLSIIQREYVLLIFMLIPLIKTMYEKSFKSNKYHLTIIIISTVYFCIYILLRKTMFYTDSWSQQLSISSYFSDFCMSISNTLYLIKPTLFYQNLITIYSFLVLIKYIKQKPVNKLYLITVILLFFQALFIGILLKLGNNYTRLLNFVSPIVIYYSAEEYFFAFVDKTNCKIN